MKKLFVFQCVLLFASTVTGQSSRIGVLRMAACDTCEQIGIYAVSKVLSTALMDAIPEDVNMLDSTVAGPPMKKTFKLITSSKDVNIVFFLNAAPAMIFLCGTPHSEDGMDFIPLNLLYHVMEKI